MAGEIIKNRPHNVSQGDYDVQTNSRLLNFFDTSYCAGNTTDSQRSDDAASGFDRISLRVLKETNNQIFEPLTHLINVMFAHGRCVQNSISNI